MPLVKVEHGLLEEDNFYLTSPVSDFIGTGSWSRTENMFKLTSGEVKRRFPYNESFVIDVLKDATVLPNNAQYELFVEDADKNRVGIREESGDEPVTNWRMIYHNGFIQVYVSSDNGLKWENKGGSDVVLSGELFQGFQVKGNINLSISDYKVYKSPYLKLQNYKPGTLARITDTDGNILERFFNDDYECDIFLERELSGKISIYDNGVLLHETTQIDFIPGDVFLYSSENIQLIYNGQVLDYKITELLKYNECFTIRNAGDETAHDINIQVTSKSSDKIELSFDNINWEDFLHIDELAPEEEKVFYIKIIKDTTIPKFSVKHFDITIY